jgi:Na+-translocating ferredoxin:NAD+ oxidoreductase RnfC subunit
MMRAVNYALEDLVSQRNAYLCCQCNLCELFSCPAGLYPKSATQSMKQKLMEKNIRFKTDKKQYEVRSNREYRMLPSKRLIARLGLHDFDQPAPMTETEYQPEVVSIAKSQHVGAPAIPVVAVGDHVEAGQLIGKIPEDSLGAAIHSSISGTVTEVGATYIVIRRD